MDGDFEHRGDGNKALKIVGVVFASFFVLALVCCGGGWFLTGRLVTEIGQAAGAAVQGSGVPTVQERELRDFTGIETEGLIDVDVSVGDDWSVMLRADDNILPLISTEVRGRTLVFSTRGSYNAATDLHATVVVPALDHVTASGMGDVAATGISGALFTVEVNGPGGVVAKGAVDHLVVAVSGMGDARLLGLTAKSADVRVDGMGDAEVHVTDTLRARVFGKGDIAYAGTPTVDKLIDGMGDVEPVR